MDLCLTDIDDVRCKTMPKIADHKGLIVTLPLSVPKVEVQPRLVWQFKDADWDGLRHALSLVQWSQLLNVDANSGAQRLTQAILELAAYYIPQRILRERKSTHPWITEAVLKKVLDKRAAEGTEKEQECRKKCSS